MGILKTLTINGTTYNVTAAVPAANVTLLASAWKSDGEAYSQVVDIPGVTAHTKVDLQPTSEQLVDFHSKDLAFVAENDGGTVTVFAIGDKPAGDHTIQITKTEVDGAGKIRGNTVGTTIKPEKALVKATNLNEEEKAQARANIGAAIAYIDGSNATPPLVLMDLGPGSYVLNGTFAYSSNPENGQYPFDNTLVQIDEIDVEEKSVRFQVADEIVCIFFTYDSYEFKRYCLADMGNGGGAVEDADEKLSAVSAVAKEHNVSGVLNGITLYGDSTQATKPSHISPSAITNLVNPTVDLDNGTSVQIPYTLRGIKKDNGDCLVRDEIVCDGSTVKLVTRLKERVFNGSENWTAYASQPNHFQVNVGDNAYEIVHHVICSHYQTYANSGYLIGYDNLNDYSILSVDGNRLRIKDIRFTDVTDFTAWMAENPITVVYKLRAPIETDITNECGGLLNLCQDTSFGSIICTGDCLLRYVSYAGVNIEKLRGDIGILKQLSSVGKKPTELIFYDVPNTNDIVFVKDELWFAQHNTSTNITTHSRYKIVGNKLELVGTFTSDFGHQNIVNYCEQNDCLIFGNGGNDTETEGNFFSVVKNPLSLSGHVTLDEVAIKYPVDIGFKVQALWGDSNFGEYNIIYLLSNNKELRKAMLLKNESGEFNGEFIQLGDTHTLEASYGFQGGTYFGGSLYLAMGGDKYEYTKVSDYDYSQEYTQRHYYKSDGTEYIGTIQGVIVTSNHMWIYANIGGGSAEKFYNVLIQYGR